MDGIAFCPWETLQIRTESIGGVSVTKRASGDVGVKGTMIGVTFGVQKQRSDGGPGAKPPEAKRH